MNVGDLLRFFANRYPNKPAVYYLDKIITYGELNARANKLGNKLLSLGFQANDKIAILMRNCSEYVEIVFGMAKIGAIPVCVNFRLVGEEIKYIVNDSDSKGLILEEEFMEEIFPVTDQLQIEPDKYFVVGHGTQGDMIPYETLFENVPAENPSVTVDENSCFVMCYTSGTTGKPKGVVASHKSKISESLAQAAEYWVREDDIHLVAAPLCHSGGMFLAMERLFIGGALCIMKRFDPEEALKLIEEKTATNAFMVPTMLNAILELPDSVKAKYDVSSMRVISCAGAPLPTTIKEGVIDFFNKAGLYEHYGSTEASVVTLLKPSDQMRKIRCAGKPFWGERV